MFAAAEPTLGLLFTVAAIIVVIAILATGISGRVSVRHLRRNGKRHSRVWANLFNGRLRLASEGPVGEFIVVFLTFMLSLAGLLWLVAQWK